ncbi:uncharacterized protein LOC128203100 [Mya arenaria]|uniref:uncharacterized protein LOC128203100 n=1 Tax=Mya arenaria TaxID=6604 RepID=UPI0022E8B630|nr:uncharacterized protein LOC128203100 [Mya arenaria]
MKVFLIVFILGIYFQLWLVARGSGSNEDWREMAQTLREQNLRLERQNTRLQQVFTGLEHMCAALGKGTQERQSLNDSNEEAILEIKSVSSTGLLTGQDYVNVSVTYIAPINHAVSFTFIYKSNLIWNTAGHIRRGKKTHEYTSTVKLNEDDLDNISYGSFLVDSLNESISVDIRISAVSFDTTSAMPEKRSDYIRFNSSEISLPNENTSVIGILNEDSRNGQFLRDVEVQFYGIDTGETPPSVILTNPFQIGEINKIHLSSTRHITDDSSKITITLDKSLVQNGGVLEIAHPYDVDNATLVEKLMYLNKVKVKVKGQDNNTKPALFRGQSYVFINETKQSLRCLAMGSKAPSVSMVKLLKNGREKLVRTENMLYDSMMTLKSLTFDTSKNYKGTYVCRATLGEATSEQTFNVMPFEPAEFDLSKTGVVKNTTDSVVLSCKGRGRPRPKVVLQVYSENGQEMTSPEFQIEEQIKGHTSRKTVTLPSEEVKTVHTVLCTLLQEEGPHAYESKPKYKIEIFPGLIMEEDFDRFPNTTSLFYR